MALDTATEIGKLNSWLNMLIEVEGADLHIKTDSTVRARAGDDIVMLSTEKPTAEMMDGIIRGLTGEDYQVVVSRPQRNRPSSMPHHPLAT